MLAENASLEDCVGYEEVDSCSNLAARDSIGEIIARRLSRRSLLKTTAAALAGALLARDAVSAENVKPAFAEVPHQLDSLSHVAPGYREQVLVRWGDKLSPDAPDFSMQNLTGAGQEKQFGYNCDFTAFLPLPKGSNNSTHGLLCVNHEYTDTNLMFPGIEDRKSLEALSKAWVDVELAAHGHSVVEIRQVGTEWRVVENSSFNRRLTALSTTMRISGPAAGHNRLKTNADPSGTRVLGTLNNCGGGMTPWGTLLICEENFDQYFGGDASSLPADEARNHKRYGLAAASRFNPAWAKYYERFDVSREPREPNRFGWVVEFDPYDPKSQPVKRTALGRFKHEGAGIVLNHDNRVVVYCGDDERFEYVYKFVTRRRYQPSMPRANRDLLDDGTLFVARFHEDGTGEWLPLEYGHGPLTSENGFHSQADVAIETRRASDLLGATPMDRPEDVEISPTTGRAYVILTNNNKRDADHVDAVNPRPVNNHGHILELIPSGQRGHALDHASTSFTWNIVIRCGDPTNPADQALYHPSVTPDGWLSCPDNGAFDRHGRLWLTTDNSSEDKKFSDGVYLCEVQGVNRGLTRQFFCGPRGAEVSGVSLTPDGKTLFVSVQHPGEEKGSDFQKPSTRWPDFTTSLPPRPAVVAITKIDGGEIGS